MSSASLSLSYAAGRCEEYYDHQSRQSHFLEACFLCHKHLCPNDDIFMYRGNTPFCSQECREEQMEIDEAKERKSWKTKLSSSSSSSSSSKRATSRSQAAAAAAAATHEAATKKLPSNPNGSVRTSTVAVA